MDLSTSAAEPVRVMPLEESALGPHLFTLQRAEWAKEKVCPPPVVYLLRPGFLSLQCALNHAISSTQRDLSIVVNTYRQGDEQEGSEGCNVCQRPS